MGGRQREADAMVKRVRQFWEERDIRRLCPLRSRAASFLRHGSCHRSIASQRDSGHKTAVLDIRRSRVLCCGASGVGASLPNIVVVSDDAECLRSSRLRRWGLKAAVLRALNVFAIEEVPEPAIQRGQVEVRIEYAGLCATDLEILEGTFGLAKGPGWELPTIMGHECSGTIVEVGTQTRLGYKVGQRVACSPLGSCGFCRFCRNGQENFCQNPRLHPGAFAEYVALDEGQVFPISEDVDLKAAAILEPVAIALRIVQRAEIVPGSTVAILGGGAIGSIVVEVAKNAGATTILVSEPVAHKRELAKHLGAMTVIDPLNQNLEDAAREATEGIGFDAVIDCTGRLAVAQQAIGIAGPGAHVVWSAVYPEHGEVPVNGFQLYLKDLSIHGVFMAPYLMWKANRMLSTLDLDPIIDFVYPLDNLDTAIADHRAGKVVKALIKP